MLSVPISWEMISSIIETDDIYDPDGNHGISNEPHITVLYGLHGNIPDHYIMGAMREFTTVKIVFGSVSVFENEDFDVVKLEVHGDRLVEMNARLCEFPFTNEFPEYNPHITIAYVKKGTGGKYAGPHLAVPDWEMELSECVYSKVDGSKIKHVLRNE
jgi:2'-5' RNA ligase